VRDQVKNLQLAVEQEANRRSLLLADIKTTQQTVNQLKFIEKTLSAVSTVFLFIL
jgi:hypothetical protein